MDLSDDEELSADDDESEEFLEDMDPEADYVPKKKKRKTVQRRKAVSPVSQPSSVAEESQQDESSQDVKVSPIKPKPVVKIPSQPVVEAKEEPVTPTITCNLPPADEQEIIRLKEFYDGARMPKSFMDFLNEDVFEAAIKCIKEGDIFDFFSGWSFKTPSPKFMRNIAKSSMDDEDPKAQEELINKINAFKEQVTEYVDAKYSKKAKPSKPLGIDLDGPSQRLPSFLEGCVVYFDPKVKNQRELKRYVIAYGGTVVEDFNSQSSSITHVIVNPDYDGDIMYNDMRVIDWKWIAHSHKRLRRLNEEAYSVGD